MKLILGDGRNSVILVEEHEAADSVSTNVALVESAVYVSMGRIQLEWQSGRQFVTKANPRKSDN